MEIRREPGNSLGIRNTFFRATEKVAGFKGFGKVMEMIRTATAGTSRTWFFGRCLGSFSKGAFEINFQVPGVFFSGGVPSQSLTWFT